MKKPYLAIFCLIVLFIQGEALLYAYDLTKASNINGGFRPYGYGGSSFADADESVPLCYGGGVQVFWGGINQLLYGALGIELGYNHLYVYGNEGKQISADYGNVLIMAEGAAYYGIIQAGAGYFMDTGDTDEWVPGFTLAPGFNMPVKKGITVPLMCRMQWLLDDERTFSISFFSGVTFYF